MPRPEVSFVKFFENRVSADANALSGWGILFFSLFAALGFGGVVVTNGDGVVGVLGVGVGGEGRRTSWVGELATWRLGRSRPGGRAPVDHVFNLYS